MNYDDFYNNYDETDNADNGHMMFGHGNIIFPVSSIHNLSNLYRKGINGQLICTIFNGEYGIYLINNTVDTSRFLFECVKMPTYKGDSYGDIFDVYEYFEKSHFLNFMIAKIFKAQVWAFESIKTTIQILNDKSNNYSKIMIIAESSDVPNYIMDDILADSSVDSTTTIDSSIPNNPLIVDVIKSNSYYKPIVVYDITFAFNRNSTINFNNIDICNFYNRILINYINDALATLGIKCSDNIFQKYGEKLLRVQYIVDFDTRLMNVKLICTPALYYNPEVRDVCKYIYVNEATHLLGRKMLTSGEFNQSYLSNDISYINKISSTDISQVIVHSISECGIMTEFCEEYQISKCDIYIFTLNRVISRAKEIQYFSEPPKIVSVLTPYYSDNVDFVISYWKPNSNVILKNEGCPDMKIHGFINFDRTKLPEETSFGDLYPIIHSDLVKYFSFSKNSHVDTNIGVNICYETQDVIRFMLYSIIDTSTNTSEIVNNKSKTKVSKMWRTKK